MTVHLCPKHQTHYNSEFHSTCPICDAHALHPDPESAVGNLRDAINELWFASTWAEVSENPAHAQQLSDIAKKAHELRLEIDALCGAVNQPKEEAA